MLQRTDDLRIEQLRPLIPPAILMEELPITAQAAQLITAARRVASDIIKAQDDRLLVIVGPCSIHDPEAALDYAQKLYDATTQFRDELFIIMRVYFEKPRTTVGWKGLINDPKLDNSFEINNGLRTARKLLLDISHIGLPTGTEFLDTVIPQFISDLISWGAIGARTTESQIHRELASGLSMPVGFKNGTTGNIQIAIDAVHAASKPHRFLGVTKNGIPAIITTQGNDACHTILRGSKNGPNFDQASIELVTDALTQAQLPPQLMVDCSHGNSRKDHTRQKLVAKDLCQQISTGSQAISGVMLESNLIAGKQPHNAKHLLTYGQSITDACIGWEETLSLLEEFAHAIQLRRKSKVSHYEKELTT